MADKTSPSEELLAAPLPAIIRDLGLAVAKANEELSKSQSGVLYTIDSAEIEVNIAISVNKSEDVSVAGGLSLSAFSVNASYAKTYGFKEEASSRIKLTLSARPRPTS